MATNLDRSTIDALWDPPEGGLELNYTLRVENARFAQDQEYNNKLRESGREPVIMLFLEGISEQSGDQRTEKFSCGPGWMSTDGGKTIMHPEGKLVPDRRSAYGEFIAALAQLGAKEEMINRGTVDPKVASIWNGARIHFEPEERSFIDRATGKEKKYTRLVPKKWLGFVTGQPSAQVPVYQPPAPQATPPQAQAVAPAPTAPPATQPTALADVPPTITPDQLAQLKQIAASAPTVFDFVKQASLTPIATSNPANMAWIMSLLQDTAKFEALKS